jgi:DNA gyrase subunit A
MTAQITEDRGSLVGALVVHPEDEVFAITSNGGVIRTRASEVRQTGRVTMGVRLMNLAAGNTVVALARNAESEAVDEPVDDEPVDESVDEAVDEPVDEAVENSADDPTEDDSGNE